MTASGGSGGLGSDPRRFYTGGRVVGGMSLPAIDYIEWIEGRPEAVEHDLGSSDLRGAGDRDVSRIVPDGLAKLTDPGPDATLRELVAEAYDVAPETVLLTPGASLANAIAAATALDATQDRLDEASEDGESEDGESTPAETADHPNIPDGFDPEGGVLVEKPAYEPLVDTPQLFGARIDRFLRPDEEDWTLSPERVEAAVMDDTALVTVTNRHNPSGRLTDRETLRATAEAAGEVGAHLLVDEVYAPYVVDPVDGGDGFGDDEAAPDTHPAFGGVTAAGLSNTVVTGSLTKFHGLGGLQVGWLVADSAFVERAERVAQHFPSLAGPSHALARRAMVHREALEMESRELLARNAALLEEFVDRRQDLVGPVYDGSTYALLAHESADGDAVAEAALDADLLVVPGRFFEAPERFRVSLGRDTKHVREALEVLDGVLDDL